MTQPAAFGCPPLKLHWPNRRPATGLSVLGRALNKGDIFHPQLIAPVPAPLFSPFSQPINGEVLEKLEGFSEADTEWPVTGGRLLTKEGETSDSIPPVVFATGHADGSVAVWHVDGLTAAVRRLAHFETSRIYTDGATSDAEKTSDWPPMRAVGEQRRGPAPAAAPAPAEGETEAPAPPATPMAIRHLVFAKDGSIVVGGDSGQVRLLKS